MAGRVSVAVIIIDGLAGNGKSGSATEGTGEHGVGFLVSRDLWREWAKKGPG